MQKNKIILCFLIFAGLMQSPVYAEKTSGFCSLREEKSGKEVIALYPGVFFYSIASTPLLNQVWIDVWVITAQLYDGIRLTEKTKIYSKERKWIGRISSSINPLKILEETDSLTHLVVSGYLEKSCVDQNFVAEEELSKLLDKAGENEKFSYFETYLQKYGFIEAIENNQYTSYLIEQPDFTKQILVPRLLLVFYRKELIAIFHTKEIRVKKYDSIEMGSQYKMIYNSRFSEHTKKEMVEIYKKKLRQ